MINITPINTDTISHFKEVLAQNNIQEKNRVEGIFEQALSDISPEDCCVFVTGSHGRKEKIGQARFELIVAFKSGLSEEQRAFIKSSIEKLVKLHHAEFDQEIEYQTLGSDAKVIQYQDKIIPTRAFDSMRIWGSKIIKKDYFTTVFSQLSSLNGKEYLSFSKNFRQSTIRQLNENIERSNENKENKENEKNGTIKPFDLNTGTLFYDGNKNRASKFPFLRTIQYQLAHQIFQQVKSNKMTAEQFNELRKQRTVPQKLDWMVKNNFIKMPEKELNTLSNAYMISLLWYESAEKGYQEGSKEMKVDLKQLKDLTNTISNFAKGQ